MTTLYPREFATRTVDLLQASGHPAIAAVHTAADAGMEVPACGVVVTLHDGWRLVVQCVRGSGPGGDDGAPEEQRAPVGGPLPATSGTAREPAVKAKRLLDGLCKLWLAAGHSAVQFAEVATPAVYVADRPHLRVHLVDAATLYVTVIAVIPPGQVIGGWALHQVPDAQM